MYSSSLYQGSPSLVDMRYICRSFFTKKGDGDKKENSISKVNQSEPAATTKPIETKKETTLQAVVPGKRKHEDVKNEQHDSVRHGL